MGSRGIGILFVDLGTGLKGGGAAIRFGRFVLGKGPLIPTHWTGGWVGHRAKSEDFDRKISWLCRE